MNCPQCNTIMKGPFKTRYGLRMKCENCGKWENAPKETQQPTPKAPTPVRKEIKKDNVSFAMAYSKDLEVANAQINKKPTNTKQVISVFRLLLKEMNNPNSIDLSIIDTAENTEGYVDEAI